MTDLGVDVRQVAEQHTKKNSAREIIKKIDQWRCGDSDNAKRRWIFELLQNAVDSSDNIPFLEINIQKINKNGKDLLIFGHNGQPFSYEELCAIIYGGTTKLEAFGSGKRQIGRFGNGFLVSHVLSRKVTIKGTAFDKENKKHIFKLLIDRNSQEYLEIIKNIDSCFDQLTQASPIGDIDPRASTEYTEYIYELHDGLGQQAANVGVEELKSLVPWILAFNEKIKTLTINGQVFKADKKAIGESFFSITTIYDGDKALDKQILINSRSQVSIAILIQNLHIVDIPKEVPRLFISMPLTGSEIIPLPFLINSTNLEPTEERDSLLLAETNSVDIEDSTKADKNKTLLAEAITCYYNTLEYCSKNEFARLFSLCHFEPIPAEIISIKGQFARYWQDLIRNIVLNLQNISIIPVSSEVTNPNGVLFLSPSINELTSLTDLQFSTFYDIVFILNKNLPKKEMALEWQKIAQHWKIINPDLELDFYTINSFKTQIQNKSLIERHFQSVSSVAISFDVDTEVFKKILFSFLQLCDELFSEHRLESYFIDGLLLNQNGTILGRSSSIQDVNNNSLSINLAIETEKIPDVIKDISRTIAYDVRAKLVDQQITHLTIVRDYVVDSLTNNSFIAELIQYKPPIGQKLDPQDLKIKAWAELLIACILHDNIGAGLPIFTKDNSVKILDGVDYPKMLLPFGIMGIDENLEDVIPDSRILSMLYFNLIDNQKLEVFKEKIVKNGICANKLITNKSVAKFKKQKLASLLTNRNLEVKSKDHEVSIINGNLSSLLFSGEIIGKISQSPERANKFFNLIWTSVCEIDSYWQQKAQASCSCEEGLHEIIPSEWLADLKCDSWVPILKDDESDKVQIVQREATRENLEQLLSLDQIEAIIRTESGIELLSHLGFDKLDLKIKRKSKETNISEIEIRDKLTVLSDRDDILNLVNYTFEDVKSMVENLAQAKENERIVRENKTSGYAVEMIIHSILNSLKLTYQIIFEGADIELWPEQEGWDGGLVTFAPYFVEIKFTSSHRARISRKQAETAKSFGNAYFVLIVEGAHEIKDKLIHFEESTGEEKAIITEYIKQHAYVVSGVHHRLIEVPSPDEIEPDINGYWLKKDLWTQGQQLTMWLSTLKNT